MLACAGDVERVSLSVAASSRRQAPRGDCGGVAGSPTGFRPRETGSALILGQPWAQVETWNRFSPIVLRMAVSVLGSGSDVHDVVQGVFCRLLRKARTPRNPACLHPFVISFATASCAVVLVGGWRGRCMAGLGTQSTRGAGHRGAVGGALPGASLRKWSSPVSEPAELAPDRHVRRLAFRAREPNLGPCATGTPGQSRQGEE